MRRGGELFPHAASFSQDTTQGVPALATRGRGGYVLVCEQATALCGPSLKGGHLSSHLQKSSYAGKGLALRIVLALTLVAGLCLSAPTGAAAQTPIPGAGLGISPAESKADVNADFPVDVIVVGVQDLGAFQFQVNFDPNLLTVKDVKLGEFLGSTGRTASSPPSIQPQPGTLTFAGFSFGDQPGPNGGGVLARITFTAKAKGVVSLEFSPMVRLLNTKGGAIAVASTGGAVALLGGAVQTVAVPPTRQTTLTPVGTLAPTTAVTPTATRTTATSTPGNATGGTPTLERTPTSTTSAAPAPGATRTPSPTSAATQAASATQVASATSASTTAASTSAAVTTPAATNTATPTATVRATATPPASGATSTPTRASATATPTLITPPAASPTLTATSLVVNTPQPTATSAAAQASPPPQATIETPTVDAVAAVSSPTPMSSGGGASSSARGFLWAGLLGLAVAIGLIAYLVYYQRRKGA